MKRTVLVYIFTGLMLLYLCTGCGSKREKDAAEAGGPAETTGIKIENKEGVPHIYNPSVPLKGKVKLELEKVCEIDSDQLDQEKPVSFRIAVRSPGGRIYLCDNRAFKIYVFDETGKLINRFLEKGEGPGEFSQWFEYSIHPLGNDVWIPGRRKIARFDRDGKFKEEIKFKKQYRRWEVVDEGRYIANYYIMPDGRAGTGARIREACCMIDREEVILTNFAEETGSGGTLVSGKLPDGNDFSITFSLDVITPVLLHGLAIDRRRIYINFSSGYKITVKDMQGKTRQVIHRDHQQVLLTEKDRGAIVEDIFFRQPPHIKKVIQENLPAGFCAITKLYPLAGNHLAVQRVTGLDGFMIDIFDGEGRYLYQLEIPGEMERRVGITGDIIHAVYSIEDRDVYRAYRIKNLPGIFKPAN